MKTLVIVGCGFAGREIARQALASRMSVVATTRSDAEADDLARAGVAWQVLPTLSAESIAAIAPAGADFVVTFPPDGATDARIAPALANGRIVYLSTTGVFGAARGRVDEATPVDEAEPRAHARLEAERLYLARGGTVLRAAGIYGPGRGLHRRILDGSFQIPGTGENVVSRIHVADLAAAALASLATADAAVRGCAFVVADDTPVPQIEAIRWLCDRLGRPLPPAVPIDQVASTLRHDRAVDNTLLKRTLGLELRYPSYREGFAACLAAEGINPRG
jgi:nucleoside-diphosphate-sugar epimerase